MTDQSIRGLEDAMACLRQSLEQLGRWGCRGFDCMEGSLTRLESWSSTRRLRTPDTLAVIRSDMRRCRGCVRQSGRGPVLFGEGNPDARLMIVCGAPSEEEAGRGRFFAGAAGELLLRMIHAMKLSPEQVFITFLVKCRPPHDESVFPGMIRSCLAFLIRQIKCIHPEVVCAMGEKTAQSLLGRSDSLTSLRGRFFDNHATKIMPTLDPVYVLDHPEAKGQVWEDLKKIMACLGLAP